MRKSRIFAVVSIVMIAFVLASGCATFIANGTVVKEVTFFAPDGAPSGYESLGIVTALHATYWAIFWPWADWAGASRKFAVSAAQKAGANGLIQRDKSTFEAIRF